MSGFMTLNNDHLIRSSLWSSDIKTIIEADLMGTKFVRMLSDFPDGDTINIPSIGQAELADYSEGQPVRYTAMDTGNFQFSITDYKASATYISNKMKQDSFYMSELVSSFVPKQARAIAAAMEADMFSKANVGQTASDPNVINGARHRFVGGGTSPANDIVALTDFAKAKYALDKAYIPVQGRVAIVDPSVEYTLNTLTNLVNVSNNPMWEGIITSGLTSGMRFSKSIYGFDVYVSHFLPQAISETVSGNSVTNGVANLFFSAASDVVPLVGAMRQAPRVDSEYNKDLQRDEYVTTARWGIKLFRPENMVVMLTDNSQVYA
jgi:HK97 family phage major capsid protein